MREEGWQYIPEHPDREVRGWGGGGGQRNE